MTVISVRTFAFPTGHRKAKNKVLWPHWTTDKVIEHESINDTSNRWNTFVFSVDGMKTKNILNFAREVMKLWNVKGENHTSKRRNNFIVPQTSWKL